jgi:hypothetical protein
VNAAKATKCLNQQKIPDKPEKAMIAMRDNPKVTDTTFTAQLHPLSLTGSV